MVTAFIIAAVAIGGAMVRKVKGCDDCPMYSEDVGLDWCQAEDGDGRAIAYYADLHYTGTDEDGNLVDKPLAKPLWCPLRSGPVTVELDVLPSHEEVAT